MSEAQPQPGDKVRVTFEGIRVLVPDGRLRVEAVDGSGDFWYPPESATVEILERADDPSRDEIGTIRGDRYVKLRENYQGFDWWDMRLRDWVAKGMDGTGVTGAVPGTPAAQAQQPATVTREQIHAAATAIDKRISPYTGALSGNQALGAAHVAAHAFGLEVVEL